MPFVRFARDRRGYEHVYLVDSSGERGRTRVLYWFRTPPGVKVGRSPFDPDTQRTIERQNPGVAFDWPQIVAARMPPPAPVENWREKRRVERAIKRARAAEAADAVEIESVETVEQNPVSGEPEFDPESAELTPDDLVGEAVDNAAEYAVAVQEGEPEPAADAAEIPPQRASAPPPAPQGRRRRRRRGRRGSTRPPEAGTGTGTTAQNGPLDPPEPAQKPSNEE